MKNCPRCKSASRQRTRRKGLIKLIPGTKAYVCGKCDMLGFLYSKSL